MAITVSIEFAPNEIATILVAMEANCDFPPIADDAGMEIMDLRKFFDSILVKFYRALEEVKEKARDA
jgi:hypothetical protein